MDRFGRDLFEITSDEKLEFSLPKCYLKLFAAGG